MDLQQIKQNRVRMILKFSIPSIIAMMLTALVTIADGFFMGNYVGKEGIAAVNLGLPIVYLYLGTGLMVSIGGAAIAGMELGAGDRKTCNQVFGQTVFTTAVFSVLISLIMIFCFSPMLSFLQADGQVILYFQEYYRIMLLALPVMVINSSFGMFIRGDGNPGYYLKISILNVVLNIILDYLFSEYLKKGAAGIAMASLVSAAAALVFILYYFLSGSEVYHFERFHFSKDVCIKSLFNGSSEFIGEISMGITMFAYNFVIMRKIGVDGVTAFTIVGYTAYAFSMVVTGFGQGMAPLVSFCYGAQEKKLSSDIRRKTNQYVLGAGIFVFLVMAAGMDWYSGLFVQSENVRGMIQDGMLIFMISFLFMGINAITSFYFTAAGKAFESAVISGARGLVVLLACIFTLPFLFGMTGVWMAVPVTEGVTLFLTVFFLYRERHV